MAQSSVSADLAAKHALPGLLGLNSERSYVFVELDLPKRADHIDKSLIPGVQALALGFLKRLIRRSKSTQEGYAAVTDDYVSVRVHKDDLDHFLISLSAMLNSARDDTQAGA